MAEGFEFTVSVPVEADLSRFRQQLSQELQSTQQTPAVVPVQPGGGGTVAVRPAAASTAPTSPTLASVVNSVVADAASPGFGPGHPLVRSILENEAHVGGQLYAVAGGQRLQLQAMGFGRVTPDFGEAVLADRNTLALSAIDRIEGTGGNVFWQNQRAAVAAAASPAAPTALAVPTNAAIAQAAVQAGVPAVVNAGNGQVVVGGGPPPGGPGVVPVPSASPRGRRAGVGGLGGLGIVGWGTALHAAGNLALAHVENARAVREAEGDAHHLIEADVRLQNRWAQSIPIVGNAGLALREAMTGDQEYIASTLRHAAYQDQTTGMMRERMFAGQLRPFVGIEREIEETRVSYQQRMQTLRDEQSALSTEVRQMYPGQPGVAEKQGRISELGKQMGDAGAEQKRAEARIRAQGEIPRMNIGARTAEFLDAGSGLNPSDAERRAILRRQRIELKQTAQEAPTLLPDIVQSHSAELFAFDRARDRANELRDVQSTSTVRTLDFAAQGRDFEAQREQQLGTYRSRMTAARGDPREMARIASEGTAAAAALYADKSRSDEAAQFLLNRDPLGAAMTMERDPMRRKVLAQGIFDQEQLRSAALRNRVEVTAMEAGGQEKSAQGVEIQRRAEHEQDAARRAGYSKSEQANILQAGLNELQTYQRQLRLRAEAGSVGETAAGGYAPSTGGRRDSSEPVVEAIRNLQTSIDQMTNELRALTGGSN